jgi:hypothetical protein
MKLYLRINPNASARVTSKHVIEYRHALEWGELKDATLDYRASAEVTQQQLKEIGIETELEEIPQPKNMESKWAISKGA